MSHVFSPSIFPCSYPVTEREYSRYQYPPLSPIWYKIIGTLIFCVGFLSGLGNGMVVYIFATTPSLRTPSNLLIVNLAFSDFCMVLYMTPVMVYNSIKGTWSLGKYRKYFFCAIKYPFNKYIKRVIVSLF